ncbi:MAG: Fe(3+) ABC transporter substrate-binding protein, partial [Paracoccaceae bacterium]
MIPRLTILTATAFLLASPTLAGEVNVYSYRQPELIRPLTDAFTAATGIQVNVAYLDKGMVERLRAEGARSPADVILTVDISRLAKAVEAGVTQAVQSEIMSANVPAQYRDPQGRWWGLTTRARVIYASKSRVADDEITTYEDLADPKWAGRICSRSGTHAYSTGLTSAVIKHLGEAGAKDWLQGLKDNLARRPQGNDRAQIKAIWAGQCDISLGNTYYMGEMLQDPEQAAWAGSVRILFPKFEDGGTHVNVSGMAMTKAAPNREEALQFMEFLTSPRAQKIYADANFEYPVAPDVASSPLVASWGSFVADEVNLMELAGF